MIIFFFYVTIMISMYDPDVHEDNFVTALQGDAHGVELGQTTLQQTLYVMAPVEDDPIIPEHCVVVASADAGAFDKMRWRVVFNSVSAVPTAVRLVLRPRQPATAPLADEAPSDTVVVQGGSTKTHLVVKGHGVVKRSLQSRVVLCVVQALGVNGKYSERRQPCGTRRIFFEAPGGSTRNFANIRSCIQHIRVTQNIDVVAQLQSEGLDKFPSLRAILNAKKDP